jgi:hypothetical protein
MDLNLGEVLSKNLLHAVHGGHTYNPCTCEAEGKDHEFKGRLMHRASMSPVWAI